jgi:hypothetical protein
LKKAQKALSEAERREAFAKIMRAVLAAATAEVGTWPKWKRSPDLENLR